ncbi:MULTISPECIES: ABC transporter substrate-binding protein [unclassified Variovorax]|uniref:ABC transporter substrate-binding protein n=1 Tax=unclassified Variovorax TaxID=663243 RepID=UPI001BD207F0|nr:MULTISPECIES: ABC transporter substrate-binding protein [unclassified Variovorax]
MPVIGYLSGASAMQFPLLLAAFRAGLVEAGFEAGTNVALDYRFVDGHYEQLPALAADLVNRHVSIIVATSGTPTVNAAKAATSTIPIVFVMGGDPVMFGIVASLGRPGGNITGITLLGAELAAKRLDLLLKLVPTAMVVGTLVNPNNPISAPQVRDLQDAARALDRRLVVLNASADADFDAAFATIAPQRIDALLVAADPFFDNRRAQIISLAARHAVPTSYIRRDFVNEGGLMSYGPDNADAFRQAGIYAGRILKGKKPADLPVMEPTRFEMAFNLRTATALGLSIPQSMLLGADEVIQ